jgi:thiol-disulfide isomerase/thioredoxin
MKHMKTRKALQQNHRPSIFCTAALALCLTSGVPSAGASSASNFTIVNHATGQPLSLYDYQGSVILLDFWAYWCGPCNDASADIEPNITQYYRNAGGNSNGVPVTVISISIDCSDPAAEDSYILNHGLELVGDDANWVAYDQFSNGYIPQFAVINGTVNSSNYSAWQILYSPYGYGTNSTVPTLKSYLDSVQTPAPISTISQPANGAAIASSNIPLCARVVTNGKIIQKVAFYHGATLLGATSNAPYTMIWSNVPAGAKSVIARAYYGTSGSVDSAAVNFTVGSPIVAKLAKQGTDLLLSWTGGSGTYQVQIATNLTSPVWQNYGTAVSSTSLTLICSNQMSFYRVVQQ